jgi:hypothetical protein
MKKIILLLISILFISCDPLLIADFFVINNCNEDLSVSIVFWDRWNKQDTTMIVKPYDKYLFYTCEGVGGKLLLSNTKDIFKNISVTKNDTLSKIDYSEKWQEKDISKTQQEFFFVVNNEDFE